MTTLLVIIACCALLQAAAGLLGLAFLSHIGATVHELNQKTPPRDPFLGGPNPFMPVADAEESDDAPRDGYRKAPKAEPAPPRYLDPGSTRYGPPEKDGIAKGVRWPRR